MSEKNMCPPSASPHRESSMAGQASRHVAPPDGRLSPAELAFVIRQHLLGVAPEDQDIVLGDEDWETILFALEGAQTASREESAKVVEQTIKEMRLEDNRWARAGLLFAARAVRRGRHLTPSEKLENFKKAMAEADEGESNNAG